jgi:hypothetical protein
MRKFVFLIAALAVAAAVQTSPRASAQTAPASNDAGSATTLAAQQQQKKKPVIAAPARPAPAPKVARPAAPARSVAKPSTPTRTVTRPTSRTSGKAASGVGKGKGTATGPVGKGKGTAGPVGKGKGTATGPVGKGKGTATGPVGKGKGTATGPVGKGKGTATGPVGKGKDTATGPIGKGKGTATGPVGKGTATGPVGKGKGTATGPVGKTGKTGLSQGPGKKLGKTGLTQGPGKKLGKTGLKQGPGDKFGKSGKTAKSGKFGPGRDRRLGKFADGRRRIGIDRDRRRIFVNNRWRTLIPLVALGTFVVGAETLYADGYVSMPEPACDGFTEDGSRLRWVAVPTEDGGNEYQCVAYSRQRHRTITEIVVPDAAVAEVPREREPETVGVGPANEPAVVSPAPPVAPATGCELLLYSEANFNGMSAPADEDQPTLSENGWEDEIASVQIKSGTWDFYSDEDYAGEMMRLSAGSYPTLDPKWSKNIGSFMCSAPGK